LGLYWNFGGKRISDNIPIEIKNKIKYTYIIIAKDLGKVNIGLVVSLVIAFLIQYLK